MEKSKSKLDGYKLAHEYVNVYFYSEGLSRQASHAKLIMNANAIKKHWKLNCLQSIDFQRFLCEHSRLVRYVNHLENVFLDAGGKT
jgi:hypothetical protein